MDALRGIALAVWTLCGLVLMANLGTDSGAPPLTGLLGIVVALGAWIALDRRVRTWSARWRGFWAEAGRASPIAVAAGISVVAGTFAYGYAYLSAGHGELNEDPREIEFEGPVREDAKSGFYVGALLRVENVDGCDNPVSVELAAFPRGKTGKRAKSDPGYFAFRPGAIEAVREEVGPTLGPRNGIPKRVQPAALLKQRVEGELIADDVPKKAWRDDPVVARFTMDLLEPRDTNSCYLRLPQFPDVSRGPLAPQQRRSGAGRLESWTRIDAEGELDVNAEASSPPPHRDFNGLPVWKCERQRGACAGVAVIEKKGAQDSRDLNLLGMGLLLSLGSAALLEGILDGLRRAAKQ